MKAVIHIYSKFSVKRLRRRWRCRIYDKNNGEIIYASTEDYYNLQEMLDNADRVKNALDKMPKYFGRKAAEYKIEVDA